MAGVGGYPSLLLTQSLADAQTEQQKASDRAHSQDDPHLRSTKEVTGYGIAATDGHLGHIQDFLVDVETWRICYLGVDTQDWWPGKTVLLPPAWIDRVNWLERSVSVHTTRERIKDAPQWDRDKPIDLAFEQKLAAYTTSISVIDGAG